MNNTKTKTLKSLLDELLEGKNDKILILDPSDQSKTLIKNFLKQAGVKDSDLQQALQSVELWVPPGMLKEDDFVIGKDCSVCHMYGTTAPWVWQDS